MISDSVNGLHVLVLQSVQVGLPLADVSLDLLVCFTSNASSILFALSVFCFSMTGGDVMFGGLSFAFSFCLSTYPFGAGFFF